MRPVSRGEKPIEDDFLDYRTAYDYLVARISLGKWRNIRISQYCTYCERSIPTNLAIEHIQPKQGPHAKTELKLIWSNFLLACVNCNSTKSDKRIDFRELLFPDRDNTFFALTYQQDGNVKPNPDMSPAQQRYAQNTIELFGLNKDLTCDTDGTAKDRRTQRLNAWLLALDALADYECNLGNRSLENHIVKNMLSNGFFSIWMAAFSKHPNIRKQFIESISGTKESGCFDNSSQTISPHPNTDDLYGGGKI